MPPVPVIIGVADVINRSLSTDAETCKEPLELMLQAVERAVEDCFLGEVGGDEDEEKRKRIRMGLLRENVDSVAVVRNWTWPYGGVCGEILKGLGKGREGEKGRKIYMEETEHGGHQPVRLLDEACRRVGRGESKVAVVTGGEALASCRCFSCFVGIFLAVCIIWICFWDGRLMRLFCHDFSRQYGLSPRDGDEKWHLKVYGTCSKSMHDRIAIKVVVSKKTGVLGWKQRLARLLIEYWANWKQVR
jgi:hypothetical protein